MIDEKNINDSLVSFKDQFTDELKILDLRNDELASMIDHTLLKPDATQNEIQKICSEAIEHKFASVCVNPIWVDYCFNLLKESNIKVCTVVGFPLGSNKTDIKLVETEKAIADGAEEIDMVINIGKIKSKHYADVFSELKEMSFLVKKYLGLLKVIFETCLLNDTEKIIATNLCKEAKVDFIKTSTGFSKSGATIYDVSLMKYFASDNLKVKASGGIRNKEDALKMIAAGASRLGTSSGVKIISGETGSGY